ncbi:MAG: hypothetical protein LBF32_00360 [Streptococcaceae bacterium]|nr:hypothetical protein [Streptococcaceae bacterium]
MQLEKLGVIFSNGINSQKARIQSIIGLNAKLNLEELKTYIHKRFYLK